MSDELSVCTPTPIHPDGFNPAVILPYGLTVHHIHAAMQEFIDFLGFMNTQLHSRGMPRLERLLMPASFSSIVGEFINTAIPKYCATLVKNRYHNGHPDLLPAGLFSDNSAQHSSEGIEVKASRNSGSWQGHNPEAVWLMVFSFRANSTNDKVNLRPFAYAGVYAAKLDHEDWQFSGRSANSRRTITATVNALGMAKLRANWVYRAMSTTTGA